MLSRKLRWTKIQSKSGSETAIQTYNEKTGHLRKNVKVVKTKTVENEIKKQNVQKGRK